MLLRQQRSVFLFWLLDLLLLLLALVFSWTILLELQNCWGQSAVQILKPCEHEAQSADVTAPIFIGCSLALALRLLFARLPKFGAELWTSHSMSKLQTASSSFQESGQGRRDDQPPFRCQSPLFRLIPPSTFALIDRWQIVRLEMFATL
jgi:hypothetical protein